MQSTNSEYGSPYLATCHVTFTFFHFSVKLLPLQFSNKCWNIPISLSEDEHQEEVKSAETEFIEGQREHERSRTLQNETH